LIQSEWNKNSMRKLKLSLSLTWMTSPPKWNKLSKIQKKSMQITKKISSLLRVNLRKLMKKTKLKK
jgi:hypothetical protein